MSLVPVSSAQLVQMTNDEYHADHTRISASGLKLMRKSPKHFKASQDDATDEEESNALVFGSLFHCVTLEPEKIASEYAVMPKGIDKRTKEGKALFADWHADNLSKTIVTQEMLDDAW